MELHRALPEDHILQAGRSRPDRPVDRNRLEHREGYSHPGYQEDRSRRARREDRSRRADNRRLGPGGGLVRSSLSLLPFADRLCRLARVGQNPPCCFIVFVDATHRSCGSLLSRSAWPVPFALAANATHQ